MASIVCVRVSACAAIEVSKQVAGVTIKAVPWDEGNLDENDAADLLLKHRPKNVRFLDGVDRIMELAGIARRRAGVVDSS